jgi:hypothetical protein
MSRLSMADATLEILLYDKPPVKKPLRGRKTTDGLSFEQCFFSFFSFLAGKIWYKYYFT